MVNHMQISITLQFDESRLKLAGSFVREYRQNVPVRLSYVRVARGEKIGIDYLHIHKAV